MIASNLRAKYNLPQAIVHTPKFRKVEKELAEHAMGLLKIVGLEDKANERANSLPYGHQRKLEIAGPWLWNPSCCFWTSRPPA